MELLVPHGFIKEIDVGGRKQYGATKWGLEYLETYRRMQRFFAALREPVTVHIPKAAQLHKGLRRWRYLEPNYLAWALVEHGEELSRKDKTDEALRVFERAAAMFTETEKSIKAHLPSVENLEERTMATNVLRGSDQRRQYCLARASLEEGRILDKKGDHSASSDKYGIAVKSLERIEAELEYEHDRREFRFLVLVSRAWEKMMRRILTTSRSKRFLMSLF